MKLLLVFQEALGVERRHAARGGGGDGLTVGLVLHVACGDVHEQHALFPRLVKAAALRAAGVGVGRLPFAAGLRVPAVTM